MALYAIGDTHLSLGSNKPMDVFGSRWADYETRLEAGFSRLGPEDICVLCGDLSWGMDLSEAAADLRFLDKLNGKKLIVKGNHDYWWNTASKMRAFFEAEAITTLDILHNNCFFYGELAVCGTRGWFYEEETGKTHDKKILDRELGRLETSLIAGGAREKLCFLHYPPRFGDYVCREIVALFARYGVRACYYGHLHGRAHRKAVTGLVDGVEYRLVSADFVDFAPQPVCNFPEV